MIRRVTPEQEIASRTEGFDRLRLPGQLFDLGRRRVFLLVARRTDELDAIELDADNRRRIIAGEVCSRVTLRFDDVSGLNLHEPSAAPHLPTG